MNSLASRIRALDLVRYDPNSGTGGPNSLILGVMVMVATLQMLGKDRAITYLDSQRKSFC